MEEGENQEERRKTDMPKTSKGKKKRRSFLERGIEALTGAFIVYISSSATIDFLKAILFICGIAVIIYAIFPD